MVQITTATPNCGGGVYECLACERAETERELVQVCVRHHKLTPEAVAARMKRPLDWVQAQLT
jgi:hypothetical protein